MSVLRYPKPAVLESVRNDGRLPRFLVIEASAGTGKTYTLEHSVVDLVLSGVPIEKLLVVTFTERATFELRERIRKVLERIVRGELPENAASEPVWEIDAEKRALLERALAAFDQAPIHTIHGFCQRVLTENAFLARRLFEQELVDSRSAFSAGFKHELRHRFARDPSRRADLAAWLAKYSVEELEKLLHDVDRKRADVRPLFDRDGIKALLEKLREGVKRGSLDQVKAALQASKIHAGTRKATIDRVDRIPEFLAEPAANGSMVGLLASSTLSELLDWFLDGERGPKLRDGCPRIGKLQDLFVELNAKLVTLEAAAAQVFLPEVQERVREEKEARGRFDFDDLLTLVGDAVKRGPAREALLARLRDKYRHALIDEFQDTDEVQWGIFDEVFVNSPDGHGLWVIGDPKQSIYGFRGADVFAYLRAVETLRARGAERVPLRENYRSTAGVIAGYNAILDQGAETPFFRGRILYGDPVRCGKPALALVGPDGQPVAPIHVFDFVSPERNLKVDEIRRLLARRIAEETKRILVDQPHVLGTEVLKPKDVFVLTRSAREGEMVGQALREQGVPFAFYKQEGLFQTEEADEIHRVLAAIDDPNDRSARTRAWTTSFFGLELEDVAKGDPPGDHPLFRRLLHWQRLGERQDYETLFASMVEESGLVRREIWRGEGERRLTNYLHVLEILLETVGRSRLSVRELAHLLRSWIAEDRAPEGENGNVQRLESDAQAVQIMTLHKSKGLEAAVVFLFGGYTDPKGKELHLYHELPERKPDEAPPPEDELPKPPEPLVYHDEQGRRVVHVGPLTQEVVDRVIQERADEEKRLVYVGLTRAKARLYLAGFGRHWIDDGNSTRVEWDFPYLSGCYVHLAERLDALLHTDGMAPPEGFEVEPVVIPDDVPPWKRRREVAPEAPVWTPPEELLAESPQAREIAARCAELRIRHAPRVVTSYSRMKEGFLATGEDVEEEVLAEEESQEDAPSPALPRSAGEGEDAPRGGTATGVFFHAVLERLDFTSFTESPTFEAWAAREDVKRLFQFAMAAEGIHPRHLLASQKIVHRALTTNVNLGKWTLPLASLRDDHRELEFCYPIPEASPTDHRGFIRGFMDYVFTHEGKSWVLDWKTDVLPDYGPASLKKRVDESYGLQVEVYALALAKILKVHSEETHAQRFGGVVYAFLRGMGSGQGVLVIEPTLADLRRYEQNLRDFEYPR